MIKFIYWLRSLFSKDYRLGVTLDPRSKEEKSNDFLHEERASGISVEPKEIYLSKKPLTDSFGSENQFGTSSCVWHGTGFAAEIERAKYLGGAVVRLSKMFGYRQRPNYPEEGTWFQWALDFWCKHSSCFYDTLPTPSTEAEANNLEITLTMKQEADVNKNMKYYQYQDPTNIDAIADMTSKGTVVPIVIYATYREWAQEYPQLIDKPVFEFAPIRHCVAAIPGGSFIEDGKKYITVRDSAFFGGFFRRRVSEDFLKARCYGAGYLIAESIGFHIGQKPIYKNDIKSLQSCLVWEGLLPIDCVTGIYGPRTKAAVKAFQRLYSADILAPQGLTEPTGVVGSGTIKKLNALFGA